MTLPYDPIPPGRAPINTLPIAEALTAIWETVPELDRPDDEADPLVPILNRLWDEACEYERNRTHGEQASENLADDEDQADDDEPGDDETFACAACGGLISMFIGRHGWQHYRGEGTAASPVELYDAGHEATP